jgi:hypothetical protein
MGTKVGRIHMKPQNLEKMDVRRISVLRNNTYVDKKRPLEGSGSQVSQESPKSKEKKPRKSV